MKKATKPDYDFVGRIKEQMAQLRTNSPSTGIIQSPPEGPVLMATYKVLYNPPAYEYMDEGIYALTGFTAGEFMQHGPALATSRIVHNDMFMNEVLPFFLNKIKEIADADIVNWYFAAEFGFERADGEIILMHQRLIVSERDKDRNPIATYGFVADMSYLKSDGNYMQVSAVRTEKGAVTHTDRKNFLQPNLQFSVREVEVLKLMQQGLSSKQIADMLSISINTVSNHRSNMLAKTKAKNTAELLRLAVDSGKL